MYKQFLNQLDNTLFRTNFGQPKIYPSFSGLTIGDDGKSQIILDRKRL